VRTKADIVKDWLPRYTGRPLEGFGKYFSSVTSEATSSNLLSGSGSRSWAVIIPCSPRPLPI
jgi:hypothetical protein